MQVFKRHGINKKKNNKKNYKKNKKNNQYKWKLIWIGFWYKQIMCESEKEFDNINKIEDSDDCGNENYYNTYHKRMR